MHGRVREVGAIQARLTALQEGEGGCVLVDGPAGIGKTQLVGDMLATASRQGIFVASARGEETDRLVPLAPLLRALHVALTSPPREVFDARGWLMERLRSELEERIGRESLLVALDDLQWADAATLSAVDGFVPQLSSYPLLWLLVGRDGASSDPMDLLFGRLEQLPGAVRIKLGPLSGEAVAQVIGDVVGGVPDSELLAFAQGVGGNPLLLVELAEGLCDTGAVEVADGRARLVSAQLPPGFRSLVARRLGGLSAEVRHLLEAAAVLGRPFLVDEVAEALSEPMGQILRWVRKALDLGVLVATDGALEFRHDLFRQAVYEAIPHPVRVALHRHIGMLQLERGGVTGRAAAHLVEGAGPEDRDALAELDKAIAELLPASPHSAADLAVRCLELTEFTDPARLPRVVTAVDALAAAGRLGEAHEIGRAGLDLPGWPADVVGRLRLTLSSNAFMLGRVTDALSDAEMVLADPDLAEELHTPAEQIRMQGLLLRGDLRNARESAESILAGRDRPGADAALAGALTTLGYVAWDEGRVADALGLLRAGARRADRSPVQGRHSYARFGLALVLEAVGEFDEAARILREGREEVEQLEDTIRVTAPAVSASRLHLAAGLLDDAIAEAQVVLATSAELGTRLHIPMARAVLGTVALLRGDLQEAARQVEELHDALPPNSNGGFYSAAYAWVEAQLADAEGGAERAFEVLADIYHELSSRKRLLLEEPASAAWLVRTALAVGARHQAEIVVASAEQLAADNRGFRSVVASAAHARGLLDRDPAALERAAAGHRHPWARGSAAEDAGVILAETDRKAARAQLERALEAYEGMGANRDAERLGRRLSRSGARQRRIGREEQVSGWTSLTDTERRVSAMVAEGLTNRQVAERLFLSRHTVDFHLRQIFRKLAIASRVQLTRIVLQDGNEPR